MPPSYRNLYYWIGQLRIRWAKARNELNEMSDYRELRADHARAREEIGEIKALLTKKETASGDSGSPYDPSCRQGPPYIGGRSPYDPSSGACVSDDRLRRIMGNRGYSIPSGVY